jgi:serine protease SohB
VTEFLTEYGLFLAKTLTFLLAVLAVVVATVVISSRTRERPRGDLHVRSLNNRYDAMSWTLKSAILSPEEQKSERKALKTERKAEKHRRKQGRVDQRARVYVVDFHGDLRASAVKDLRETVTAILSVAQSADEVVVRLESPGGQVHGYGLAASQLARIREHSIPLTVSVDKVAASGGYLMACVADRIVAAPFAIVGSIGVLAQIPNFNRLLKKHSIDFEQVTAGEHKRTLSVFGENTEKGRAKLREEIEDVHALFKAFVKEHRPSVDIDQLATGEHWHGQRALDLKLVDELRTSDDYLVQRSDEADLYEVSYEARKSLADRLASLMEATVGQLVGRGASSLTRS